MLRKTWPRLLTFITPITPVMVSLVFLKPTWAQTELSEALDHQEKVTRVIPFVSSQYVSASNQGQTLTGIGGGAGVRYAFHNSWAVSGSLHQAYSLDNNFTTLFTKMSLWVTYAITGRLTTTNHKINYEDRPVFSSINRNSGGIRAFATINQYLFTGSDNVFPLSGLGLGGYYEFPSSEFVNFSVGGAFDQTSNGVIDVSLFNVFFTASFQIF